MKMDELEMVKEVVYAASTSELDKVEVWLNKTRDELNKMETGPQRDDMRGVLTYVLAIHHVMTHYEIKERLQ